MKTVINKNSGLVLFAIQDDDNIFLNENEMLIDSVCDLEYDFETQKQYWNLETQSFYIL